MPRVGGMRPVAIYESYSTTFPATENPLVGDGLWLQGQTVGLDWTNTRTTTNKVFGTQSEGSHGTGQPGGYNDSATARQARTGRVWSPNQDVRGRIYITSRSGWSGFHEVELHARVQMSANSIKLYEAIFSVTGGTTYYEIVMWNGPLGDDSGDFTFLAHTDAAGVDDGTYVRFTAIGPSLALYTSTDGVSWGTAKATATDSTLITGLPGFGMWTNGNGNPNTYGLSEWSAQAA